MENVLKAKIVGDITDYKAKMAQVEAVTEKSTKEIIQLQTELRRLKKEYQTGSIDLDTYSKRVAKINNDLNAHTRAITQARGSFKAISGDISSANGVALEFNRIIQDAPYGIIGVANNLQQVGSNFGQLASKVGSSSKALSLSLKALVSGINPYLLAFNALTVALTLYSQGVFGATEEVDDLKEAQDALNDSLKETDKLARAAFYNQLLKDLGLLRFEVDATGKALGAVPTNLPFEEQLKRISDRIKTATKPELEALAQFLKENYQNSVRAAANATNELEKQIAESQGSQYKTQLELVNDQLKFYKDNTDKAKDSTKEWNAVLEETNFLIGLQNELAKRASDVLPKAYQDVIDQFANNDLVKNIDLKIAYDPATVDQLTDDQKRVIEQLQDFRTRAINLNQEVGNLIQKGLTDMISQTFFAFGEAIGNGENAIGAAGKALLGSFAAFLGQFGKLLIQYGIAGQSYAVITKALLSPLTAGPASIAAIAAGAALIAISGAISGALRQSGSASIGGGSISPDRYSNIPGREFGGPVVAGRPYIVGERRAELFIPQTNGIILPSLGNGTASSPLNGFSNTKEMMIRVEVEGVLENEQIRLANKRGEHRIKRT